MNTAMPQSPQKSGLFHAVYRVGSDEPGSPSLTLDLVVSTVSKQISGTARITQTTNPVTDLLYSPVHGKFETQKIRPGVILSGGFSIAATGYLHPDEVLPINQPHGFELMMTIDADWTSGSADYTYRRTMDGPAQSVTNAAANLVPSVDLVTPESAGFAVSASS